MDFVWIPPGDFYMNSNPASGYGVGSNYPACYVSWNDIKESGGFIETFNSQNSGYTADLPTEAQWEYAVYSENNYGKASDVGSKLPNAWGLYDMSGNLWEWCKDYYCDYTSREETDPTGPSSGSFRVERGGSWGIGADYLRSARRHDDNPSNSGYGIGFRLCLAP